MIFLLVPAAFIRGRRLFEGGVYSNNYGRHCFNNSLLCHLPVAFQRGVTVNQIGGGSVVQW